MTENKMNNKNEVNNMNEANDVRQNGDGRADFKISRVVLKYIPLLFTENRITDEDVAFLMARENRRKLGVNGYDVLKVYKGEIDIRYYRRLFLTRNGTTYLLTRQFQRHADMKYPIIDWLEKKGFDRQAMLATGYGEA